MMEGDSEVKDDRTYSRSSAKGVTMRQDVMASSLMACQRIMCMELNSNSCIWDAMIHLSLRWSAVNLQSSPSCHIHKPIKSQRGRSLVHAEAKEPHFVGCSLACLALIDCACMEGHMVIFAHVWRILGPNPRGGIIISGGHRDG